MGALFATSREFSDLTPTQYDVAYEWLERSGLLGGYPPAGSPREAVFLAALMTGELAWLHDADLLIQDPDELPADAAGAAATLSLSAESALGLVASAWRKVDLAERQRVGQPARSSWLHGYRGASMQRLIRFRSETTGLDTT